LFYWRDRTGNEIDVLLDQSGQAVPIEIKTAATFTTDFVKGINYWKKINSEVRNAYVVYTGKNNALENTQILNWKEIDAIKN
jgi:predicted AAA+ superfamily ATPase